MSGRQRRFRVQVGWGSCRTWRRRRRKRNRGSYGARRNDRRGAPGARVQNRKDLQFPRPGIARSRTHSGDLPRASATGKRRAGAARSDTRSCLSRNSSGWPRTITSPSARGRRHTPDEDRVRASARRVQTTPPPVCGRARRRATAVVTRAQSVDRRSCGRWPAEVWPPEWP